MSATKIITPPTVFASKDICYDSPIDGRPITSMKARRDDLARTNCRPYEGFESESKEAARKRADEEKKQDAKLHENVSKAYYQLPPSKRKVLAAG